MTKTPSPFLPIAAPVRKKTVVSLPLRTPMLEPVRYDRQECSEHYFEGRYDGLDMHNNFALRVAIGDLRMMSQKWRTRG